ncbi:TPA: hypothetical protein ACH3X1_000874 [Trebouxia sp. C0004]
MSAIQRLMTAASSGAASNSSNSSAYDDNKIEKRACELERRREKALKDTKGTARWWKFFQVVTSRDLQTDEATAVHLLCTLCDTKLSATNESRIATTHLKHAGCSKVKSDTEIAAQVAAAFIKDAAPEQQDPDDKEVLAQLQHRKRKTSGQPSVAEVFLSKEKQVLLTMALYDLFLERSDCVAMHACEHPSLQRFCSLAGIKPLNRKRLAGPVLDKKYAETVGSVDQVLNVNGVHALAVSTI